VTPTQTGPTSRLLRCKSQAGTTFPLAGLRDHPLGTPVYVCGIRSHHQGERHDSRTQTSAHDATIERLPARSRVWSPIFCVLTYSVFNRLRGYGSNASASYVGKSE